MFQHIAVSIPDMTFILDLLPLARIIAIISHYMCHFDSDIQMGLYSSLEKQLIDLSFLCASRTWGSQDH